MSQSNHPNDTIFWEEGDFDTLMPHSQVEDVNSVDNPLLPCPNEKDGQTFSNRNNSESEDSDGQQETVWLEQDILNAPNFKLRKQSRASLSNTGRSQRCSKEKADVAVDMDSVLKFAMKEVNKAQGKPGEYAKSKMIYKMVTKGKRKFKELEKVLKWVYTTPKGSFMKEAVKFIATQPNQKFNGCLKNLREERQRLRCSSLERLREEIQAKFRFS